MKRFLAMALALLMVISVTSMSVMAAAPELNLGTGSCDYYNLIEKNDYNLAPGAVESEIILNDDSGTRRQVVHVVEVDPNNDNISVMPSFKNIGNGVDYTDTNNWGIMEMSKQAAYVEETLGKNVVAAMNGALKDKLNTIENPATWPMYVFENARQKMKEAVRIKIKTFGSSNRV